MMKNPTQCLAVLIVAIVGALVPTAQGKLTVGDPAPGLQVGKWVQGAPVKRFDSNNVYIIEFWAVWCAPCRGAIPHLNQLQAKFKDKGLITIGQDVWEGDESNVPLFLKMIGEKISFRVALDDKSKRQYTNGVMAETWMVAAGLEGIPVAFVVDRHGTIAWIGHPLGLSDNIIEEILADKFDIAKYRLEYEQQQMVGKQRDALYKKLRTAMQEKNWDAADALVSELEKELPEQMRFHYANMRLQILMERKDYDGAVKLAGAVTDAHKDSASFQNEIAWTMVAHEGLNNRGLLLAETIAERANTIAHASSSAILDTLARAQFMLGKKQEAIATQKKAVYSSRDEGEKRYLTKTLEDYRQDKLPKAGE